jgi:DNA repair protein RadA/Sms
VSASTFGNARRTASGLDPNRLSLLLAGLDKRAGLNLATDDVFVNVAEACRLRRPAADLAVVAAVASSLRNRPSRLTSWCSAKSAGREVRATAQAALRVREAAQLGFTRCVLPEGNSRRRTPEGWTSSACARSAKPSTQLIARTHPD